MKHILHIACLIITLIASITFTMDIIELQQQPINNRVVEIVNVIHEKIYKQYSKDFIPDFATKLGLTAEEKLDIISLAHTCCEEDRTQLSKQLINNLRTKNIFFDTAIDYFSAFAHQNVTNITYATIDTINNPENKQPILQLNTIPQPVKKYIMKTVCKEMSLPYNIPLTHDRAVRLFAIHPKSDTAISYCNNNTLYIWDLKTGSIKRQITNHPAIDCIQFNQNGSLIALTSNLLTKDFCKKSRTQIRNTQSAERITTIKQNHHVYFVDFMHGSNNTIATFVFEENSKYKRHDRVLRLWQLNEKNEYILVSISSPLPWRSEQSVEFLSDKKKYEGNLDEDTDNKVIQVTAKRRTALHLCNLALQNHKDIDSINNIQTSQTYQQLTEYEQQLVIQKTSQIQKNSQSLSWFQEKKYI